MTHIFQVDLVKFLCTCGMLKPITGIYFCRHCLKLRCGNCVSHEVDTLYCPHCSENMPSTEAKLKKNRCANCFDCPSCGQTLSTRAATVQIPNTEDPNVPITRKVYYLGCTNCRWTTRDVGLEDQLTATGGWNEQENENEKRIQDLFEYYRNVAQREKCEAEKKRSSARKTSYLSLSEKYSMSSSFSSLMSRKSLNTFKGESALPIEIQPSEAVEEIQGILNTLLTDPISLSTVSTLEQRLASPERQPKETSKLYPMHKHILVKKSHRCRQCEHNLSKPEYNPSSIKFKIQLGAYYHVPEIRIAKVVELKSGVSTTLQLTLCNPTPHDMTVALLPFESNQQQTKDEEVSSTPGIIAIKTIPQLLVETPDLNLSANVVLPQGQMILAARDDTAEYDDTDSSHNYKDDPTVVAWRRANKIGVNVQITPNPESKSAIFGLTLRYDYTNTVATASENRTVTLNVPVIINAGKVL